MFIKTHYKYIYFLHIYLVFLGTFNIEMVEIARSFGFAAKQAGSGGAIICITHDELCDKEFEKIRKVFDEKEYIICKVKIPEYDL
jgi:hypothetical protein